MNANAKRRAVIGAAMAGLILGVSALAGCSGSATDAATAAGDSSIGFAESGSPGDVAGGAPAVGAPDVGAPEVGAPTGGMSMSESAQASAPAEASQPGRGTASDGAAPDIPVSAPQVTDRQIIRTAAVTLQVSVPPEKDDTGEPQPASSAALADAATRAAHAVRALATLPDAYVAGSDGHGATITITLRIPAGQYDGVMSRLADIGDVTQQSESTTDVTGEMVDVASRLRSMQASVDRLRALMAEASSMQDVIALESELSSREADLESLQRRQATLSDQVALSTIAVTVNAIAAPLEPAKTKPVADKSAFIKGLEAGWRGITAVGRAVAAVLGALLPFLLPLAVLGLAGWFVTRSVRTRRRSALPAVAAGHPLDVRPDVTEVHHDADHRD